MEGVPTFPKAPLPTVLSSLKSWLEGSVLEGTRGGAWYSPQLSANVPSTPLRDRLNFLLQKVRKLDVLVVLGLLLFVLFLRYLVLLALTGDVEILGSHAPPGSR